MTHLFEDEPLLNEETIEELWELDGGSGFMQDLVSEFNLQNQRLVSEIIRAAEDHDYETLRFSVHTLKGSSLNVGACRQAAAALAVENACKEKDTQAISQLAPFLVQIAGQTEESLRLLLL